MEAELQLHVFLFYKTEPASLELEAQYLIA